MMIKESNNWKHMDFVQSINNMENMEYKFSRKGINCCLEGEIGDYNTSLSILECQATSETNKKKLKVNSLSKHGLLVVKGK